MEMVWRFIVSFVLVVTSVSAVIPNEKVRAADTDVSRHLLTVYDRGSQRVFLTQEKTIGKALLSEGFELDSHDTVEPSVKEELVASVYKVNIYRARPVVVVDGAIRVKTISPYQTAQQIAEDVGITIYDGDQTTLTPLRDYVNDGAGLELVIARAKTITLELYGKTIEVHTRRNTVKEMLTDKNIKLGDKDRVSVALSTPITEGMLVRVTREGKQTVAIDQAISSPNQIVYDANRPLGYRAVQTAGVPGVRSITYELEIRDGIEISRVEIASIVTRNPTTQTEVIGIYNDGSGLTKSRGAQQWTDSKGVTHRETYYDLNMKVVMQSCGQGGYYTVRPDGAKVDAQGYILIAANYGNYPKCSLVETSLGTGRVYDTGGFALRHPHGFDLATDWSNPDGI